MLIHKKKNGGPKKKFWYSLALSFMLVSMVFMVCSNYVSKTSEDPKSEYHQEPQEKSIPIIENEHEDYRNLLGTTEGYVSDFGTLNQAQENMIPTAVIDRISPSKSKKGEYVEFIGYGIDEDGDISEYLWESDTDGLLSQARAFTSSELSKGTHVITFRVRDNSGDWSDPVQATIEVEEGDGGPGFDPSGIFENPMLLLLFIIVVLVIIVAIVALLFGRKGKEEPQVQIGGFDNLGTRNGNR